MINIGLYLNSQYAAGTDMAEAIDWVLEQTILAAELGFDSVWAGEHHLTEPDSYLPQIPLLSRISAHLGSMTLGTNLMLLPLHDIVAVAEHASFLDHSTQGRFVLGVGQGYRKVEFEAFGRPFNERSGRVVTGVDLLRRLWSGEPVTHEDGLCRLDKAVLGLLPRTPGGPPIWLGATRARAIRRVAGLVDGFMMAPHLSIAEGSEQAHEFAAAAAGGTSTHSLGRMVEAYCHEDAEVAVQRAMPSLKHKYGAYAQWGLTNADQVYRDQLVPADQAIPQDRFAVGSPDQVADFLVRQHDEVGVKHAALRIAWPGSTQVDTLACLRLLGEQVLPEVRRRVQANPR